VSNGAGGLAILTDGLPEHEPLVRDDQVTVAVTLLRCVGSLSRGDLKTRHGHAGPAMPTPGAQCLGAHTFRFGITPLGPDALANVSNLAETFLAPPYVAPSATTASLDAPFLTLTPDYLVLSSFKVSEDGARLTARFYNPTVEAVQVGMTFGRPIRRVDRGDAAENVLETLAPAGQPQRYALEVGPAEIVTLLVTP
jgi:alpha-mannosidase